MKTNKNIFNINNVIRHFIFVLCLLPFALSSQVEVHAVLDSSKIRIGEQVRLDLYLKYDASLNKNISIQWPTIVDTLKEKVEVLGVTKIDTTIPNKAQPNIMQQHMQLLVTSFDSGYYAIPPFEFIIDKDTSKPQLTEVLLLEVYSVPTDTSFAKVKDIKAPFNEPFDWKWYLPYIYIGIAILLAILILIYVLKKLKDRKPIEVAPPKPKIPAHITALASLEKIKQEAIWKENKTKEYYSEITDTIRLYIEERFKIQALELTSDEIIHVFKSQVIDSDSKSKLYQMLTLSDFVKFAKQIPIEAEHTLTLNNAFDFVNGTKREEEVIENQQALDEYNSYMQKQADKKNKK